MSVLQKIHYLFGVYSIKCGRQWENIEGFIFPVLQYKSGISDRIYRMFKMELDILIPYLSE